MGPLPHSVILTGIRFLSYTLPANDKFVILIRKDWNVYLIRKEWSA